MGPRSHRHAFTMHSRSQAFCYVQPPIPQGPSKSIMLQFLQRDIEREPGAWASRSLPEHAWKLLCCVGSLLSFAKSSNRRNRSAACLEAQRNRLNPPGHFAATILVFPDTPSSSSPLSPPAGGHSQNKASRGLGEGALMLRRPGPTRRQPNATQDNTR